MNKYYPILYFTSAGGKPVSRPNLLKHFQAELIDECLDNGYLVEIRRNAYHFLPSLLLQIAIHLL